ncbi:MAG: hypothetical protein ABI780_02720 [Ardenticatenales bacterium]
MNHRFGLLAAAKRTLSRTARRFTVDRRGGTAVQAMAMMPLIIIATFTLFKMWEVVQVRESLHTGSYEAVRYLSLYPPSDPDPYFWDQIATRMIEHELRSNPWVDPSVFIGDASNPVGLDVTTTFDGSDYDCRMKFDIAVDLHYRLPNIAPLPGVTFTLHELRNGEILCK